MAMTPIGELIDEVQRAFVERHRLVLTYGDIAGRSGGRVTRQRVQQLAKGSIKSLPTPDVIYGLSLGLEVPESVVLERALASAGYTGPRRQRREETRHAAPMNLDAYGRQLAEGLKPVRDAEQRDGSAQSLPERPS